VVDEESHDNEELQLIFESDQEDRSPPDWERIRTEDPKRRARVAELLQAGAARTGADFLHAAMVFQHGRTPEDYLQAKELALRAVELGRADAKWLAAAAEDRYLMVSGQPQKFGTQFRAKGGAWVLHDVDPSTSDTDRASMGVPTLAAQQERAREMTHEAPPPARA